MATTSIAPLDWDDRVAAVTAWAEFDHQHDDDPRARLLGYVADQCVAVVDLRPFPHGGAERPVVEALAALLAAGCDGLVAALPGRAWSLDDPVAPVTGDVDLRQPVVAVHVSRRGHDAHGWLLPYRRDASRLVWLDRHAMPEGPRGWIPDAIEVGVQHGLDATRDEAMEQLERCSALGHEVTLVGDAVEHGIGRLGAAR